MAFANRLPERLRTADHFDAVAFVYAGMSRYDEALENQQKAMERCASVSWCCEVLREYELRRGEYESVVRNRERDL